MAAFTCYPITLSRTIPIRSFICQNNQNFRLYDKKFDTFKLHHSICIVLMALMLSNVTINNLTLSS